MPRADAATALDADWRARAAAAQVAALPSGRVAVSAPAPFGAGGLGRHLQEIVAALQRGERDVRYFCEAPMPAAAGGAGAAEAGPERGGILAPAPRLVRALGPVTRFSPPLRMWAANVEFDRRAARALSGADQLIAFSGAASAQFRRASATASLGLVSPTAHIATVLHHHERAYREYPLERSWAPRVAARTLAEYGRAERIYVSSQRVQESFLEAGVARERLARFPLTPDPRFQAGLPSEEPDAFEVVYVGSLSVVKGVPLLVDAIARVPHDDLRLVLIGGWGTRGMRRFMERACARDRRVEVRLGDPLEWLARARLYVHPSYDDGFAYAPAEALAAGVPALVTENTGMKDLIDPGANGAIVPSGDVEALREAIDAAYRGELVRA